MKVTLADGNTFTLPLLQFGVMGIHHHGKSRLCASMATPEEPLLVLACDPMTKMQAYFDRGIMDDRIFTGAQNQPIRVVRDPKTGKPFIQIECFLDSDPVNPWGFQALLGRLEQVRAEVLAGTWKSLALDSWSQLEFIAKLRRSTGAFKADNIMAAVKDDCESVLKARLASLPCNLGVTMHINSKMVDAGGGTMLYEPVATGTLKSGIGATLGEMYRAVATPQADVPGGIRYNLQTIPDGRFDCGTNIGAPNGCENDFKALFGTWIAKRAAMGAVPSTDPATAEPASAGDAKE